MEGSTMDAVVKIGGSLAEKPEDLKALCSKLTQVGKNRTIVAVPGGGKFADIIRELDSKFNLPQLFTHRMAILAMDQFGLFLSQIIADACLCDSVEEAQIISGKGKVAIFLPSRLILESDPFEPSWDITSDSISAYIGLKAQAEKIILITDVDGIFDEDPKLCPNAKLYNEVSADQLLRYGGRTSVDSNLPQILLENKLDGYVVNGAYPQRVVDILLGQKTLCTHIVTT